MKKTKPYRRLAVSHQVGLASGGWLSLYLGADHLLLRTSSGFVESYRRFYFADIEAITIRKTDRGGLLNALWGVPLMFSVLFLIFKPGWASAICTNIFFVLLALNIARGPTCVTTLQTRVQRRPLPFRRVKKALKVIESLSGKIAAAQAGITIAEGTPEVARSAPPALPSDSPAPPPLPGAPPTSGRVWVHLVSFGMLVVGGLVSIWEALHHQPVLLYCVYAAGSSSVGWGIAALVQQRRWRPPSRIRPIAWINVVGHAIVGPFVYGGFAVVYGFQLGTKIKQGDVPKQPAQLSLAVLRDLPGFDYFLLIYGATCILLGLVGYALFVFKPRGSLA